MLKRLLLWFCKHLDWHSCLPESFDGVSSVGHCRYCGCRCLTDSNGDWFRAG
jgi:hypothetical protein